MTHQLYENWLFSDEPRSLEEDAGLQVHLQDCSACRSLAQAWQDVEGQLQTAPLLAPAAGFTGRFQARLAAEQARLQRRQSLLILGFALLGAGLLFASLVLLAAPLYGSLDLLFWCWVYRLANLFTAAQVGQEMLSSFLSLVANTVSPLVWVLVVGVACQVSVLWVVSCRLLTNPRRISHETKH